MDSIKNLFLELKWLILFCILSVLCVCLWKYSEKNIFINVPSKIVEYCENKYPEDSFKFVKFKNEQNNLQGKTAIIKNKDNIYFTVTRQYLENGELSYSDNYIGVKCYNLIKAELESKMPNSVTYSILIEDSVFSNEKNANIDVAEILYNLDTVIALSIKDNHIWSMEEVDKFCKSLPFRVNVVLVTDDIRRNFSTTRDFEVVYR